MAIHPTESVERAHVRFTNALDDASKRDRIVHVGEFNRKTGCIGEGTLPLVTCSAKAVRTCGRECYAVWHIANLYPSSLRNLADNTIERRLDANKYYTTFAVAALSSGKPLRVNESGDFETADQLAALFKVCQHMANLEVIGYTRREELISMLASAPANCHIRYSLYRDGDPDGDIVRTANVSCVSSTCTTCPSQLTNGKWHCAACAAAHIGCCSSKPVIIFKAH